MRLLSLLGVAAGLALAAAPARAGTVGASASCYKECLANVGFSAEPGEHNRLVFRVTATAAMVRDDAAPLRAGSGCVQRSAHEATCAFPGGATYSRLGLISTGDGDDEVALSADGWTLTVELGAGNDAFDGGYALVHGEEGADVLSAGEHAASLDGGSGDDRLSGGSGADFLRGGEGIDSLAGGGGDDVLEVADGMPDRADGGPGRDRLSYADDFRGVVVDLADAALEGAPGEGDAASAIEDVAGGSGADRIAGDNADNRLVGGSGSDAVAGRGGDDVLVAAHDDDVYDGAPQNRDRLDGGRGNDRLGAGRRQRTRVTCGSGRDVIRVTFAAPAALARNCERIVFELGTGQGEIRFRRRGIVEVPCPAGDARRRPRCMVRVRVTARRAVERRASIRRGDRARLRFGRVLTGRVRIDLRLRDHGRQPVRAALIVAFGPRR